MDYIREAENILWYYNNIYNSLQNIEKQITRLKYQNAPREISATNYDQPRVSGGGRDSTENIMYQIQVLTNCRDESLLKLDEADKALQEISQEPGCENYGVLLRLFYIEKLPKDVIAARVGYSQRKDVYRLRDRAIRKFAVNYFGIRAI